LKTPLHILETLLARLALAVVPRLPRSWVLGLAKVLGRIAYACSGHLRRVGQVNLQLAFGTEKPPEELRRILILSFQNFALVMLDTFWFSRRTRERVKQLVRFGPGAEAVLKPQAHICITAHLGNWEILGMAFAFEGYPLTSVAAPLVNERLNRLFNSLREATGQHVVSKHGALRSLLRALKDGGKIALVLDQNTKPVDGGLFVDFFGKPVPVSSAPAALAIRTGSELYVGICLPKADGSYETPPPIGVKPPAASAATETEQLQEFTQRITKAVEDLVRNYPEHWLWTYKRWKYVGPGRRRDEYPFYAKELPKQDQ
jgi:lauroyl/myristoyl acyltransferase